MTLYQRSTELRDLDELLSEAKQGHGRVVLVSGVAGAGKTALLHEFWTTLDTDGDVLLLTASCAEVERDLAYGVLSQLFEGPALSTADTTRAMELLEAAARGDDATASAARGVTRLVLDLAARLPVVICVDDVHNADHESVKHLLRLIRGLHSTRVLAVLTTRTRPFEMHSPLHTELLRQPHVRLLQLDLLSRAGVRETIAQEIGTDCASGGAVELHALTGGNPMLVHALLEDMRAAGTTRPTAGAAFSHAMLGCLYSAGISTVDTVRGVALLDEAATPALLNLLLDIPLETVVRAVAELAAIGLMDGCTLRHPDASHAVLADMDPAERVAKHEQVARLLLDTAADPSLIARHLLSANTVAEPWMVDTLIDAANSLVDSDPEQAKACLELARRHDAEDVHRQADIAAGLARIELLLQPSAILRLVPQLSSAINEGHITQRLALDLPEILFWYGRAEENEHLFEQLTHLVDTDDPAMLIELRVCRTLLTNVFPSVAERIPQLPAPTTEVEFASGSFVANTRLSLFTKLRSLLVNGPTPDDVRGVEQVLSETRITSATAGLLAAALVILIRSGQLQLAEKWTDHLLSEATDRGAANWQGMMAEIRARVALRLGDLGGAERYARLALRRIPSAAWGVSIGGVYATLLRALTEMGRLADAADLLGRLLPESLFESIYGLEYLYARAHYYLATHRMRAALTNFEACGALITEWRLDQSVTPWRCGAALALLRMGDDDAARALIEEQLDLLTPWHPSDTRGKALRVLAASGPVDRRPAVLADAITLLADGGDRLELAKAYHDLCEAHRCLDSPDEATAAARAALRAATECQAGPLAEQVAVALHGGPAVSGGRRSPEVDTSSDLSEAERRVFLPAARGSTNREIAAELFITVSTVEQHLTRIYRKLRVRRRKDLHTKLAALPDGIDESTVD
jgi:DNA-binding CsgD family transcriptional regulator/tetratricopeptide (TPR) repeat protein